MCGDYASKYQKRVDLLLLSFTSKDFRIALFLCFNSDLSLDLWFVYLCSITRMWWLLATNHELFIFVSVTSGSVCYLLKQTEKFPTSKRVALHASMNGIQTMWNQQSARLPICLKQRNSSVTQHNSMNSSLMSIFLNKYCALSVHLFLAMQMKVSKLPNSMKHVQT